MILIHLLCAFLLGSVAYSVPIPGYYRASWTCFATWGMMPGCRSVILGGGARSMSDGPRGGGTQIVENMSDGPRDGGTQILQKRGNDRKEWEQEVVWDLETEAEKRAKMQEKMRKMTDKQKQAAKEREEGENKLLAQEKQEQKDEDRQQDKKDRKKYKKEEDEWNDRYEKGLEQEDKENQAQKDKLRKQKQQELSHVIRLTNNQDSERIRLRKEIGDKNRAARKKHELKQTSEKTKTQIKLGEQEAKVDKEKEKMEKQEVKVDREKEKKEDRKEKQRLKKIIDSAKEEEDDKIRLMKAVGDQNRHANERARESLTDEAVGKKGEE